MRLVLEPAVREHIEGRGGAVYVWAQARGCCRGRTLTLECATERPEREFELVHAAAGFRLYAAPGLREPQELHLALGRRGRLEAFWNGQGWIG